MVEKAQHANRLEKETTHTMKREEPPKVTTKAIDLWDEEYTGVRYSSTKFRRHTKPILFLQPIDELGKVTGEEVPVVDGFLDEAVEGIIGDIVGRTIVQ